MHRTHTHETQASDSLLRQLLVGAAGGGLVLAGSSPAIWRGARRLAIAALTQGILLGRALARTAEEARLQAEDLYAEAEAAAGTPPAPPPGQGESVSQPGSHGHGH